MVSEAKTIPLHPTYCFMFLYSFSFALIAMSGAVQSKKQHADCETYF